MKKLIIIDGNSLAFGKNPKEGEFPDNMSKSSIDERDIFIVRKFMKKMLKLKFGIFSGYELIVIFDEKDKDTFRHQICNRYKRKSISEKRSEQKRYIYSQIDEIKKVLDILKIPHYSNKKWEADDIIGMLCHHYEKLHYLITVVSGDKDMLQLISNKTRIAYTGDGNFFKIYDKKNINELTNGLFPSQIIDKKILFGDRSDNIKGLGIKRSKENKVDYWTEEEVVSYVKKYKSIDNMLKNIEEIPEPYRNSLILGLKKIELNRNLVTIIREWSIEVEPSHFEKKKFCHDSLLHVLKDLNLEKIQHHKNIKSGIEKTILSESRLS